MTGPIVCEGSVMDEGYAVLDPGTADLARRLQDALPQYPISLDEAIEAARRIEGEWSDPVALANLRR